MLCYLNSLIWINHVSNLQRIDGELEYLTSVKCRKLEDFGHIMPKRKIPPDPTYLTRRNTESKIRRMKTNIVAMSPVSMDWNGINRSVRSDSEQSNMAQCDSQHLTEETNFKKINFA